MKYIDQWLSGLGLEYIIPKLYENGITTPKKLALLTLRDMYEVGKCVSVLRKSHLFLFDSLLNTVGVEDAEDRKKLYYLIQRLQKVIKSTIDIPL